MQLLLLKLTSPRIPSSSNQSLSTFQDPHSQGQQANRKDAGTDDAKDVVNDELELKAHEFCVAVLRVHCIMLMDLC